MGRDKIELGMAPPAVRGRARVQLFDAATGNETLNVQHENFVSERWLRAMAWFANWGAFANNLKTSTATTAMQSANAFRHLPFTGIALTDYDGAPDQNERLIRGAQLAFGVKGVAADGNRRGGYNADESVHSFAYHKLVFDFTTNQANGVFQSIYSSPMGNVSGASRSSVEMFSLTSTGITPSWTIVRDDNTGALYRCTTSQIAEVVDWTPLVWGSQPVVEVKATLSPTATTYRAFAIRNSRLYWLASPIGSTRTIVSAPLSDLTNQRIEKTLDAAWGVSHGANSSFPVTDVFGFAYHAAWDVFLISVNHSRGPKFSVMAFDPVTFADGDKWGAEGSDLYHSLATYPGEASITTLPATGSSGNVIELLPTGETRISTSHNFLIAPLGGSDLTLSNTTGGTAWLLSVGQHFFSRALLDAPVEKTAQNTMKITYEFTFDEPVLP